MKRNWKILRRSYTEILKLARVQGKEDREICGFLIDNGYFLQLQVAKNTSEVEGSFEYCKKEVKELMQFTKKLGVEIVGTFHSHPISEAIPGANDVKFALDDSLMLIFDCIGNEGRLWYIRDGGYSKRIIELI